MSAPLTEQEFSQHLNTKFEVSVDDRKVELELVEVKAYAPLSHEQAGLVRFSVFFEGPDVYLPQRSYSLTHERMGEFDIFLVPIAQAGGGYKYEAVFNYYQPNTGA